MLALWLEQGSVSFRTDVPVPRPPPGEVLVRVSLAGVCNTDLELVRGYYPFTGVLGHEFVGTVETPGPWCGRRVCGEINAACGLCSQCRADRRSHCDRRTVLGIVGRDGAFAEYLTLPQENLHEVPDQVSDAAAVFTEPLAAAYQILEQVTIGARDRVYVLGDGKLGQLCAQVLAATGCDLTVVGRHPRKLQRLHALGVRTATSAAALERGDVVVECTGSPEGFEVARRLLRPRGTFVLKSTYAGQIAVDLSRLVVDEIALIGSRCGPFGRALEALARGAVAVEPLIDACVPLGGDDPLELAGRPGQLKILVDCRGAGA